MKKARYALGLGLLLVALDLGLVAWPPPPFGPSVAWAPPESSPPVPPGAQPRRYRMRDGATLTATAFGEPAPVTVVFVHGILASSASALPACALLHDLSGAQVIAVDLRGHGHSDGPPGDVAHLDQYQEDLADLVAELRRTQPATRIVLAGHSMGGGIELRYAEAKFPPVDGYLWFAPLFGPRAPTMRELPNDAGGSPVALALPRVIGLAILNLLHLRFWNGLPTLLFHVAAPLHAYSFRSMMSMAPRDYAAALRADERPLLVLVGAADEVFVADRFAPLVAAHVHGQTRVLPGDDHNGVVGDRRALGYAAEWLKALPAGDAPPRALAPSAAPAPR